MCVYEIHMCGIYIYIYIYIETERETEREREPAKCCKRASVVQQSHQVFLVLTAEVGDLHPDFVAGLLSTTRIRKANKKVYYYYC